MTEPKQNEVGVENASPVPLGATRTRLVMALVTILPTFTAIIASAMLVVDEFRPAFCTEEGSGCLAVKSLWIARPFGIPLSVLGLVSFVLFTLFLFLRGERVRKRYASLAFVAAAFALSLILVQLLRGTVCKFCMIVDVSTLVLAFGANLRKRWKYDPPKEMPYYYTVSIGALASMAAPLLIGFSMPEVTITIPPKIEAIVASDPKRVVIVDFTDFECPHCRKAHSNVRGVFEKHKDKIVVIRKHVPFSIHPHARDAAKAVICVPDKFRDAYADELYVTEDLGVASLEKKVGEVVRSKDPASEVAALASFKACLSDEAKLQKQIDEDTTLFRETGGKGLPTLWIGRTVLRGSIHATREYEEALVAEWHRLGN